MTPALPKIVLSTWSAPSQRVAAALKELQEMTPAQKKCKQAGLISYLRGCPDNALKFATGEDKDIGLAKFHLHQLMTSESKKHISTEKNQTVKNSVIKTLRWMSQFQLYKEFGTDKGIHWEESGLLPLRGDRVTGSMLDKFKEYGIPDDYEQYTEDSLPHYICIGN